ncbi:hypothetical protein F5X97DRAFT_324014 [Nemania serpens]|nr:hypothetical protein F5X97DRAFT_324014 [Nemania serpens]
MGKVDVGMQTRGQDRLLAITTVTVTVTVTVTATAIATAIAAITIVVPARSQSLPLRLAPQNVFHKQIDIASLDKREVRGRWKSFVSKWNSGELAEGWYRPETFEDVLLDHRAADNGPEGQRGQDPPTGQASLLGRRRGSSARPTPATHVLRRETHDTDSQLQDTKDNRKDEGHDNDDENDDDYGPMLPTQHDPDHVTRRTKSPSQTKSGPGIPTLSDLTLRHELEASALDDARAHLRQERKADRTQQRERLDEAAPRADAGSQARRLEKKREVRDANAAFAGAKASSGDMPELADAELMGGGGGGGVEEYKRLRQQAERKKTEREIRREEVLRAKKEEREERARVHREREAVTVDMLREIARSRFG